MEKMHIGYDIGTKSIKAVYGTDARNYETVKTEHFSDPQGVIEKIQKKINERSLPVLGYATGRYRNTINWKDSQIATIDWTRPVVKYCKKYLDEDVRYLVDIGAAGLSLLEIKEGKFHRFATNSVCASGTGSFLDQQMIRMGLSFDDIDNMKISERVPGIASRCAVFAKSDLIHRQQEGYSIQELWNGLVKGMAEACYITLLRGDSIKGKLLLIGGLVKNKLFLHYFSNLLDKDILIVPPDPDSFLALANYHFSLDNDTATFTEDFNFSKKQFRKDNNDAYEQPLNPPHSLKEEYYTDPYDNEITIYEHLALSADMKDNSSISAVLGVDIGSTSTKAVLIHDKTGELLVGLYRKTHGNPISAYQKILRGINRLTLETPYRFEIKGMGTTGSGRKIVGAFAGADKCVNEITAHLKGALKEVPDVKTIFEIGGQDSKYIFVEDGWMKDANMNYVCAAGTGSFLEEQAQNLNFKLNEFEDLCRGVPAPKTNDRCTVFMEQDSKKLLIDGHSKSEVVASLLYSVCKNYLHRVVQNRPIEEPILFLGATARNKGLVEAFSNILQKRINTSPNSHLTGAIGVAELVRVENSEQTTNFKGFSLHSDNIEFKERYCTDCHNKCRIIYFESESGIVSWGYQCGKEGLEKSNNTALKGKALTDYFKIAGKIIKGSNSDAGKQHKTDKTIYIPKALFYYSHSYLWQQLWDKLGYKVEILPDSDKDILATALTYSPNEICFPLKMAIGHVINAIKQDKLPLFLPHLIKDFSNENTSNSYFCPMTQGLPPIIKSILEYNEISADGIIDPVIDLSSSDEENIISLQNYCKDKPALPNNDVSRAFKGAIEDYIGMNTSLFNEGQKVFESITAADNQKPTLIIIGRSYNLYDNSLNLGLLKEAQKYGYEMIPADLIPADKTAIGEKYGNMYWSYGQKVIAVAQELNKHPHLYPIFLTNFNCGPDSFILSIVEDIWKDKPSLVLELDEHSGNAGYLTRIEAFLDRIEHHFRKKASPDSIAIPERIVKQAPVQASKAKSPKSNILLVPPMNPIGTVLTAGAFRSGGYDAIPMIKEDINTFHLGKSCLRGSECMPAASTIGSILDYCTNNDEFNNKISANDSKVTVFMPCASGPCRFGQYALLHQMVYDRKNIAVDIMSVNSENDYAGTSVSLRLQFFKAVIITDILIKIGCKIRPYEREKGAVDTVINRYLKQFAEALEKKKSISKILKQLRTSVDNIDLTPASNKPLVGIVGEIYVRNSPFSNDNLIEKIEYRNAEAWLTPFMEWLHYTGYLKKLKSRPLKGKMIDNVSSAIMDFHESSYYGYFDGILTDRREPEVRTMLEKAAPYITDAIRGEAVLTIGRSICFIEQGASLIVNVAPFGCMPGTISSILLKNISQKLSVPIVSLYYDGYIGFDTQLEQYLNNLDQKEN